jgi:hypothetical protein
VGESLPDCPLVDMPLDNGIFKSESLGVAGLGLPIPGICRLGAEGRRLPEPGICKLGVEGRGFPAPGICKLSDGVGDLESDGPGTGGERDAEEVFRIFRGCVSGSAKGAGDGERPLCKVRGPAGRECDCIRDKACL